MASPIRGRDMAILEENDILFAHKALNIAAGITEATKRVAGAIIDHFNKRTGQCDPSIERLATLLGIDRATVLRATDKLDELGFIEKASHGGKAHRARYLPNWERFRTIVEDWDARMKSGDAPGTPIRPAETSAAKVADVRRSRSQGCDVKRRRDATQTLRSNPSKEPVETERVETRPQEPIPQRSPTPLQGLWRGSKRDAQRSMLLPIIGGRSPSHADAARAAAERRWYAQLHALGEKAEVEVLEWMTRDRQEATTQAEMQRQGGGIAFIEATMRSGRIEAYG
jgi:predicted transcriptional regulator